MLQKSLSISKKNNLTIKKSIWFYSLRFRNKYAVHLMITVFKTTFIIRSIYLDMSIAFDIVWPKGLILNLRQNGLEEKL